MRDLCRYSFCMNLKYILHQRFLDSVIKDNSLVSGSVLVRHSLLLLLSSALATSTAQTAHTQRAQGTIKNFKIRKDISDKNPGSDKETFPSSAAADEMVSSTINSYLQQTVPFIFGILLL